MADAPDDVAIIILFGLNCMWPDVFGPFSQCRRAETRVKIFLELSMAWLLMYCWGALRHYLREQSQGHHTIDCLDVRCRRMKGRLTVRKQGHPAASIRRSLELFQRQRLKDGVKFIRAFPSAYRYHILNCTELNLQQCDRIISVVAALTCYLSGGSSCVESMIHN